MYNLIPSLNAPFITKGSFVPIAFEKIGIRETIVVYVAKKNPITPTILTERQKTVNRLGGEQMVIQGLQFGTRVQDEVCNFPLLALIKPGTYRMNRLPKGMILLGDSGNGRA